MGLGGPKVPNTVSLLRDGADPSEAKVFLAHALPQGACENLVCALKLLPICVQSGQFGGHDLRMYCRRSAGLKSHSSGDPYRRLRKKIGCDPGQVQVEHDNVPRRDHPRSGGRIDIPRDLRT